LKQSFGTKLFRNTEKQVSVRFLAKNVNHHIGTASVNDDAGLKHIVQQGSGGNPAQEAIIVSRRKLNKNPHGLDTPARIR
jgi:hypothetical protein